MEVGKGAGQHPESGPEVSEPVVGFVVVNGEGGRKSQGEKRKEKIINSDFPHWVRTALRAVLGRLGQASVPRANFETRR